MPDDLLVHTRTKAQLDQFLASPSHGLIFTGEMGLGKRTLAVATSASLLGLDEVTSLGKYPYFTVVDPDENSITIEQIRDLQKLLTLKTPRHDSRAIRRVIIIVDAQRMRNEAQNAFLKSLEEPPADTCIIMTSEGSSKLLPTMYSRAQRIEVLPVGESAAKAYFTEKGVSSADFSTSYALSQGQPGLLSALLNESEHELREWVKTAKSLLSKPAAERLLSTDELAKDKLKLALLLNALQRIVHAALASASRANKLDAIKRWTAATGQIQISINALCSNANSKILLDDLLLNL